MKYFAALREMVKKKEEELRLERGSTVNDALEKLSELYGDKLKRYVFDEKSQLRGNLAILVNGENIPHDRYDRTVLRSKDVLVILPPIAGG